MGQQLDKLNYTKQDHAIFRKKICQQLEQLQDIIAMPNFGNAPLKVGAELEYYLIDQNGEASPSNLKLLTGLNDPQFQPELNLYNLELNLTAVEQKGAPFTQLGQEIAQKSKHLRKLSQALNIDPITIGILPTLQHQHLTTQHMSKVARYHNMDKHLREYRGENFKISINGAEPVELDVKNICAEGANTSFQVHLMTKPQALVDIFNAAQLTLPLVCAIGANSPIFMGNRLWDETRIALFKQSVDIRRRDAVQWKQSTRVNFGHGWLRKNIWELYAESVSSYQTILPYSADDDNSTGLPALSELSLHMSTVWPWHRPVYCNQGNGHIRIEFRAIPSGPTSVDMLANAAFAIGLANGLINDVDKMIAVLPFHLAEYNFYRAAEKGLDAKILWPLKDKFQPEEVPITEVIRTLLPIAHQGLLSLAIEPAEISFYLGIIEQRLNEKMTGAIWQQNTLIALEKNNDKQTACKKLVQLYLQHSYREQPVAMWERSWT